MAGTLEDRCAIRVRSSAEWKPADRRVARWPGGQAGILDGPCPEQFSSATSPALGGTPEAMKALCCRRLLRSKARASIHVSFALQMAGRRAASPGQPYRKWNYLD